MRPVRSEGWAAAVVGEGHGFPVPWESDFRRDCFSGWKEEILISALSYLPCCPAQYNMVKKWLEVEIAPDIRGRIPLLLTSLSFKVSVVPWTQLPVCMYVLTVDTVNPRLAKRWAVGDVCLSLTNDELSFKHHRIIFVLAGSETSRQEVPGRPSPEGHRSWSRFLQGLLVPLTHRYGAETCLAWEGILQSCPSGSMPSVGDPQPSAAF